MTCRTCRGAIDLAGHFGRPPVTCSPTCRRRYRADIERDRRRRRSADLAELDTLRAKVDRMTAVLAA